MKTKIIKSNKTKKWSKKWATFTAGFILFLLMLVTFLSRPVLDHIHGQFLISQGVLFPAAIMSAVFWSIIELFTPPGRSYIDLLERYIPALILGLIVGGALGYLFDFGSLVLAPAYSGNIDAIFFVIAAFISGTAILADAVWEHDKGFLGQRGPHLKRLSFSEGGKSKGRRLIIVSVILFVVIFIAPFIGTSVGHALVSGHDHSDVLAQESTFIYINGTSGPIPFAVSNGTATYSTNGTTSYIVSDLTLAELNNFDVSKIVLSSSMSNYSLILGTGSDKSFTPIASFNATSSKFSIPLQTEYITGNQSAFLVLKVSAPPGVHSFGIQALGNNGLSTVLGPLPALDFSYLLGGIIVLASTFFGMGMVDIDISKAIKGVRS